MFFGPLMMFAVVAICVAVMFFMMRGGTTMHRRGGRDPVDILKERFARGEINQAEYEDRKRLLQA
jgi:putative membrane protein